MKIPCLKLEDTAITMRQQPTIVPFVYLVILKALSILGPRARFCSRSKIFFLCFTISVWMKDILSFSCLDSMQCGPYVNLPNDNGANRFTHGQYCYRNGPDSVCFGRSNLIFEFVSSIEKQC